MDLQNQVQPANTRDLDKLNQSMASRPDLTPVAKQVTPRPHPINTMLGFSFHLAGRQIIVLCGMMKTTALKCVSKTNISWIYYLLGNVR